MFFSQMQILRIAALTRDDNRAFVDILKNAA